MARAVRRTFTSPLSAQCKPKYYIQQGYHSSVLLLAILVSGIPLPVKDCVLTVAPVISIIEDDAFIRAGLNNLVRSLGYIVGTFASAAAFLQSAQLHKTC